MGPPLGGVTKRRSAKYLELRLSVNSEDEFIDLIKHPEIFPHPRFRKDDVALLLTYLRSLENKPLKQPASHKVGAQLISPHSSSQIVGEASQKLAGSPEGHRLFVQNSCISCHSVGGTGGSVAPSLDGIGARRTREYIRDHISNPAAHIQAQTHGKRKSGMADPGLFPEEVDNLTEFVRSLPADAK